MGSSVEKAWIWNWDTGSWWDVQYNPKEFKFDEPVSWTEHDDQGQESALEFQKSSPATMQMELIFDTTSDGNDVRLAWVNKLLELTNATISPSTGEATSLDKKRPPKVSFIWNSFELIGVIESVNATYTFFSADGTPLRATVTVKMKEWAPEEYAASGSQTAGYGTTPVQLVQLQAGQTITAVALDMGTTTQAICDANNIDDPLNVPNGTVVAVPTS